MIRLAGFFDDPSITNDGAYIRLYGLAVDYPRGGNVKIKHKGDTMQVDISLAKVTGTVEPLASIYAFGCLERAETGQCQLRAAVVKVLHYTVNWAAMDRYCRLVDKLMHAKQQK
jgi:hypothetical protein